MKLLGKLDWSAIPLDQPIPLIASGVVGAVIVGVLVYAWTKGWWPYVWHEWITSVDHKRIGVMYMLLGCVMLLRGFAGAVMMRSQQALALHGAAGYQHLQREGVRSDQRARGEHEQDHHEQPLRAGDVARAAEPRRRSASSG